MTDRYTIRVVVTALAVGVIGGLGIEGWLASTQTAIPDQLDRVINLLTGGLIGVLASTRSGPPETPTPVEIVNDDNDPVPAIDEPRRTTLRRRGPT